VLDAGERVGRLGGPVRALQRPPLRGRPAHMVAQEVQRDGVQPRLLRAAAAVVADPGAQRPLERVRQQVLGQRAIARPVGQEGEQALGLGGVEPLELVVAECLQSGIGPLVRISVR
jgi:hypothetical protein